MATRSCSTSTARSCASVRTRKHGIPSWVCLLLPGAALADGGIHALGALLPLYIALLGVTVGSGFWFVLTLVMLSLPAESLSLGGLGWYRKFSGLVIVLQSLFALLAMFLTPVVLLLTLVAIGITAWGMAFTSTRVRERPALQEPPESDDET